MRRLVLVLLGLPAFLVAGCATGGGTPGRAVVASPEPATPPASYSYVVTSSCGERSLIGRYRIVVEGGEVTGVRRLDGPLPALRLGDYPTLADLEDLATDAEPGAEVTVRRDAGGRLRSLSVDHDPAAIDDEECYEIGAFEAGVGVGSRHG